MEVKFTTAARRIRHGALVVAACSMAFGAAASAATPGETLFKNAAPPCSTCHAVQAGREQPGPSLAGIAAKAKARIAAPGYKGKAKDARAYIRESIVNPSAFIPPAPAGATYGAGGNSLMPSVYGQLKPEQIEQLVDYLMTLK